MSGSKIIKDMIITKAERADMSVCADLISGTDIGKLYYPSLELLNDDIERALLKNEIFVAKVDGALAGIVWFSIDGMFRVFSYLHIIAVSWNFRGIGVASRLMDHFEKEALVASRNKMRTKTFLLTGEYNDIARSMYEKRGYVETARIDGLFRRNVTEILYMKNVRG